MGFRISTEVGRMNIDMVWAEIAVAALAGSVFYGVVALIERAVDVLASVRPWWTDRNSGRVTTMKKTDYGAIALARWRSPAATALAADPLTLQLKWVTQAQFAGYYVAKDKGFYKDEGLDVDDQAGRPGHRARAGDRRRRRRRDRRLDGRRARRPREGRAAGQHRPAVQEVPAWS